MRAPADDDAPFVVLAFKIMDDPFVGIAHVLPHLFGPLTSGTTLLNSTKDKKSASAACC